jgi:hypothetical protein
MITLNSAGSITLQNGGVLVTAASYSSSFVTSSYPVSWISQSTTTGPVAGIAGYAEANADQYNYASAADNIAIGQSFLATGNILTQATFFARVNGTPPGNCIAALYAHTGTFGTTGTPTGPILATSDPVAATSFPGNPGGPVTFTFTGANQYSLTSGSAYVIALYYNSGSTTNHLGVEIDISAGTNPGRCYYLKGVTWTTTTQDASGGSSGASDDLTFAVSGSSVTTINYSASIVDSYAISNRDRVVDLGAAGSYTAFGQSFRGDGRRIISASVSLAKSGSATGNLVLQVFNHSGSHGVNGIPVGVPYATSDIFNVANLTTTNATYSINFTGPNAITTNINQSYFLTALYTGGSAGNTVSVGVDGSSPTHTGNAAYISTGSSDWIVSTSDMCFVLYSV